MYSWCTREEWLDDYVDLDWLFGERGCFGSYEEAKHDAEKHGYNDIIVVGA